MDQSLFEFDPQQADLGNDTGFELGWDHAHHGLVPPAELLFDGTPIGQGWRAGKAVFGRRTLVATPAVRNWLALRTRAWRRGIVFEGDQVTPNYLAQIGSASCPVTRRLLGGPAGSADAATIERLHEGAAYAAGLLAVMSERAAAAKSGLDAREALRRAARIDAGIEADAAGLSPAEHGRLAVLMSFVEPLPFAEAARIPMRALPPNRVRLLNAVQGLQAQVTLLFAAPGWSGRLRAFAERLADADRRLEFKLFVGALAPRLLEAGAGHDARSVRRALEDAWADERVNRRWQAFVLALGEKAVEALLERAAEAGLAGMRTCVHEPAQAVEGWSLASRGRVLQRAPRTAARPLAPPSAAGQPLRN